MNLTNKKYQDKIVKEYLAYLSKVKGYSSHTVTSYEYDIFQYLEINQDIVEFSLYLNLLSKNPSSDLIISNQFFLIIY